jgi:DNA repair protein RadC
MPKDCAGGVPQVTLRLAHDRCLRGTSPRLSTPSDAVVIMRKAVGKDAAQENFVAVYVGSDNMVLATQVVALGGLDQTAVDPRVLLGGAVLAGATAMVIGHNHPSGNVQASAADLQLTRQLVEATKLLSIRLLDHVVFSDTDSYSFLAHGQLELRTR